MILFMIDRFGLEKNQGALINLEIVKAIDSEGNLLDLSKPEIVSEFVKKLEQIKANKSQQKEVHQIYMTVLKYS